MGVVWVWYGRGMGIVWVWYGCDMDVVRVWYRCGMVWYGCGMDVVWAWYGCGTVIGYIPSPGTGELFHQMPLLATVTSCYRVSKCRSRTYVSH